MPLDFSNQKINAWRRENGRVVHREVLRRERFTDQRFGQSCLANLARSNEQHRWGVVQGFEDSLGKVTRDHKGR